MVNHWHYRSPENPIQWLSQFPTSHPIYSMCYIYQQQQQQQQQQKQQYQEQVWFGSQASLFCYATGRSKENQGEREIFSPVFLRYQFPFLSTPLTSLPPTPSPPHREIPVGTPRKTIVSSLIFIPITNHIWGSTSTDQAIFVWDVGYECVKTIEETDSVVFSQV